MDPVTHALISATLDRAGLRRISRNALAILVVAGTAADLDLLSYFGGASAYFHYHFALLHSILGSAILAVLVALAFYFYSRRTASATAAAHPPLRFAPVLLLCIIGAAVHVLFDCLGADGVQLFWPFRTRWFAFDLLPQIDPWILAALIVGIVLPALFRLVSEEIGERKKKKTVSKGAVAALLVIALYTGERGVLHQHAIDTLMSFDYHGAAPLSAGAFPDSVSPFLWRGLVDTANTIEQIDVPLNSSEGFRAASSLTSYKPTSSPALSAARRALLADQFLRYARFPLAETQAIPNGTLVTLRDLRFPSDSDLPENIRAVIELDGQLHIRSAEIDFASSSENPRR
jgi:inner membrane protein